MIATVKEVISIIENNQKYYKDRFMIFYKDKPMYLNQKAKNMYKSYKVARLAAIRHLYTNEETIDQLIKDNILKINKI